MLTNEVIIVSETAVGWKIKMFRKLRGLTQSQLAEKSGVATISIRQYETGKRQPRIEQLQKIADALDVLITQLVDFTETDLEEVLNDDPEMPHKMAEATAGGLNLYLHEKELLEQAKQEGAPEEKIAEIEERCQKLLRKLLDVSTLAVIGKQEDRIIETFLLDYFHQLNVEGQDVAIKRVAELTEIPRYQKQPEPMSQEEEKK